MTTIAPQERQLVLDQLAASESRLFELTTGLTPAQWHFNESPERWSIAENVEHLVLFESFILNTITTRLNQPAEPEKRELATPKQSLVLGLANARHITFNAREFLRPSGQSPDPAQLLSELHLARERTIAFASETQANLSDHFFPHVAWGDLDCYQWLLLIGQHTLRHVFQIEEIMANPAYPKSAEQIINTVYAAFNSRDIDAVFAYFHPQVEWPNGMEGGYVHGLDEVRAYWTRQWQTFDPRVDPVRITPDPSGSVVVDVHQVVRDISGTLLADVMLQHIYTIRDGLITFMEIQTPVPEPASQS